MVGTAVVVSLTKGTDAAAGFIYLLRPRCHRKSFRTASRFPMPTTHEQADFAHAKSFVLCSFQPTKSACSASAEKCLSGVGQPLSSVSGRKRYNTLDFAKQNRVPTGMLLTPIGNPEPRDFTPLDTPIIFSQMVPTLKKLRFTMSDLFSKMPQHTTFIFAEALQKSQPVPWGAEQKFRVCQHRKFPRHAAAAEKQ